MLFSHEYMLKREILGFFTPDLDRNDQPSSQFLPAKGQFRYSVNAAALTGKILQGNRNTIFFLLGDFIFKVETFKIDGKHLSSLFFNYYYLDLQLCSRPLVELS